MVITPGEGAGFRLLFFVNLVLRIHARKQGEKMKTMVVMVLFAAQTIVAQEAHLWIGLSGNRVMLDAILRSVQDESVTVVSDGRIVDISLREIEQVRVIHGGLMMRGAAVGASTGFAVGGLIGFLGAPRDDRNTRIATTALAMGIIGGIIGSVIESMPDEGEILDLRGKTAAAKKETFEEILRQPEE